MGVSIIRLSGSGFGALWLWPYGTVFLVSVVAVGAAVPLAGPVPAAL